jgi:hypothetical protein
MNYALQENFTGFYENWFPGGGRWTNGGSIDPAAAADAVYANYRGTQRDLVPYLQVDGEYINEKHALVNVSINKTKLDPVSFNTTGASTHLNQSRFTRGIYAAPRKTRGLSPVFFQLAMSFFSHQDR